MSSIRKRGVGASLAAAVALVALAWVLSMLAASAASAQGSGGPPQGRPGPPAEALAACKSLAAGAACSFSGQRGSVAGTCFAPQPDLALACRPKDAPAPGGAASGPRP